MSAPLENQFADAAELQRLRERVAVLEQQLARAEHYRMIADSSLDWVYWSAPDGTLTYVSPACEQISGYTPAEFMTDPGLLQRIVHPDDQDRVSLHPCIDQALLATEFRIVTRYGAVRWIQHLTRPVFNTSGDWIGQHVSNRNISLQKEREETYRTIIDQLVVALVMYQDDAIVFANPATMLISGYEPEELLGLDDRALLELIHPEDHHLLADCRVQMATGHPVSPSFTLRIFHKDGSLRWLEGSAASITFHERPALLLSLSDVSAQVQAQHALRESQALLQTIVDHAPAVILAKDLQQRYTLVNRHMERMIKRCRSELLGLTAADLYPPEMAAAVRANDQKILDHGTIVEMDDTAELDGRPSLQHVLKFPLYDGQGAIVGIGMIATDMTARKEAETRLEQANAELVAALDHVRQHAYNLALLRQIGDMLQGCESFEAAYTVIAQHAGRLFAETSGALFVRWKKVPEYEARAVWGDAPSMATRIDPQVCRVLASGRSFRGSQLLDCCCSPSTIQEAGWVICVPLLLQNEILGVLHLRSIRHLNDDLFESLIRLVEMFVRQLMLVFTNLSLRELLQQQALQDGLTGLYNRRYLDETLPREIQRAHRAEKPLGLIMLDIDHFKRFNDNYGHDAGDVLLREVGSYLQQHTRGADIACRFGGEEFVLVLPDISRDSLVERAEQVRRDISNLTIRHAEHTFVLVTVSLGLSLFPDHAHDPIGLLKAADQALYAAKHRGRNRVVLFEPT
jgi:diguanylate cyclase (GGDEF)-like protein/PAS domain S-box-containing protein